jgi:hypothetical protein
MTSKELRQTITRCRAMATESARMICLNPANADIWRKEVAKFRAMAAAAEVDLRIIQSAKGA